MQLPLSLPLPSSATLRKRLRPLVVLGAVVGGAYALVGTAARVLQESQQRLADERRDRENLKRRFAQNQDDVSFTVLALLPTLAEQLWAQMDVEAVTASLQQGRKAAAPAPAPQPEPPAARQEEPAEPYVVANGAGAEAQAPAKTETREPAPATANAEADAPAQPEAAVDPDSTAAESGADALAAPAAAAAAISVPLEDERAAASASAAVVAAEPAADDDAAAAPAADAATPAEDAPAPVPTAAADGAADAEVQPAPQPPKKVRSLSASAAAFVPKGMAQPQVMPQSVLSEETAGGTEDNVETLQREEGEKAQDGPEAQPRVKGSAQDGGALPNGHAPEAAGASALDSISEPPPPAIPADARLAPPSAAEQPTPEASTHGAEPSANGTPEAQLPNGAAVHEIETAPEQADATPAPPPVPELSEEEKKEQLRKEQRAKLELWNELRIVSISRTITSLYALVLLTLQTSVQLNVLGRRAYLDSVSALYPRAPPPAASSDAPHQIRLEPGGAGTGAHGWGRMDEEEEEKERKETEQLFLTFSWWFLHRGWEEIAALVRESVTEVFGSLPLKTPISHADFLAHLADVRRRIEYDLDAEATGLGASMMSDVRSERSGLSSMRRGKRRNFATALYPAGEEAELDVLVRAGAVSRESTHIPPALRALLDETRDVLESRDFSRVLRLSLNRVFAELDEALRPAFGVPPPKPPGVPSMTMERFKELDEENEEEGKRVRLAALLPAVARQSQLILCAVPNTYAEALADLNELKAWSAIVYTAWDR